jgi:hypothetical protein
MAGTAAELSGSRGPQTGNPASRAQKENGGPQQAPPLARFFLAKPGASGATPALERECATEAEAIAEAFKTGVSYYAVSEYRALVDCSGKQPVFKKEAVKRNS